LDALDAALVSLERTALELDLLDGHGK
jgi:hypothetical protein